MHMEEMEMEIDEKVENPTTISDLMNSLSELKLEDKFGELMEVVRISRKFEIMTFKDLLKLRVGSGINIVLFQDHKLSKGVKSTIQEMSIDFFERNYSLSIAVDGDTYRFDFESFNDKMVCLEESDSYESWFFHTEERTKEIRRKKNLKTILD